MQLRLSDTRSHAEEFHATTLSEFTLGLYEALGRYQSHFESRFGSVPRPHLHIRPANTWGARGKWIDAGYGRGTHVVLFSEMMQNTAYISTIWDGCQRASQCSDQFETRFTGLIDATIVEVQ